MAFVHEEAIDLTEVADLESALADYLYEVGGRTMFQTVDYDRLVEVVGHALLCQVVLHRLGYFRQARMDRLVWSNRPLDGKTYRTTAISFANVNSFVPGRGFVRAT